MRDCAYASDGGLVNAVTQDIIRTHKVRYCTCIPFVKGPQDLFDSKGFRGYEVLSTTYAVGVGFSQTRPDSIVRFSVLSFSAPFFSALGL